MARTNFFDIPDTGEPFPKDFPKQDQEMILTEERKFANELMRWYRSVIKRIAIAEVNTIVAEKMVKVELGEILAWFDSEMLWSVISTELREIIEGFFTGKIKHSRNAKDRKAEIVLDFKYLDKLILEAAEAIIPPLVANITSDIRKKIKDQVYVGLQEGKTISQVRDSILSLGDVNNPIFSRERALKIASTEMIRAYNQGAVARFKSSGVVRGMRWVSAAKGFCSRCGTLDGKVVPLGEVFYADPTFGDGMPPRHPHCRCSVIPVTLKEAKDGDYPTLHNDYRNNIQELWDNDAFTMVNGIKVTGGARGHYIRTHGINVDDKKPQIEDLAAAERLLEDILQNDVGPLDGKEGKPAKFTRKFENHYLKVVVGTNLQGEQILLTMFPSKDIET